MFTLNNNNNKIKQKIIRFKRKGVIRYPLYDIVVIYKNNRDKGKALEKIGFYNPHKRIKSIFINRYRLSFWLLKGVFMNFTVKKYLVKFLIE